MSQQLLLCACVNEEKFGIG